MRQNIYYWKCDNPLSIEEKLIYNDKYKLADISETVREIALYHYKKNPSEIRPTGSAGNHYTYLIIYPEVTYFFRADDGKIDDDYMEAERMAIDLAQKNGIPVPKIYFTDTSKSHFPVRYQIMEKVSGSSMKNFFQDQTLDKERVSKELGRYLGKLHNIKLDGFGFFDTSLIREKGVICGLDSSNSIFFYKNLNKHIEYLLETHFLSEQEAKEILDLFHNFQSHIDITRGSLVHKDIAFWNMVGTEKSINAIVDWDDVISGDPIDDLAVVRCFYEDDIFMPLLIGYQETNSLPDDFYPRLWMYFIRNMLWKAVFRTFMRYFDFDKKVAILNRDTSIGLREFTYNRIRLGINNLKQL